MKIKTVTVPIVPQPLHIGTIEQIVDRVVEEVTGNKHNVIVTQSKANEVVITVNPRGSFQQ